MKKNPTPATAAADADCGDIEGDVHVTSRFRTARPLDGADRAKGRATRGTDESESVTGPERSMSERLRSLAPTILMALRATGRSTREFALLSGSLAMIALFATACASNDDPHATSPDRTQASMSAAGDAMSALHQRQEAELLNRVQLEAVALVKMATAKYHTLAAAQEDGFTSQYPAGCAASPVGAQGIHYLNPARVDTLVELLRPELVMYEPQRDGRLELVGVDYVVPFAAWTRAEPPQLLGMPFGRNEPLGVWALHIWNWRSNPLGTFAMWNPRVSCEFATP